MKNSRRVWQKEKKTHDKFVINIRQRRKTHILPKPLCGLIFLLFFFFFFGIKNSVFFPLECMQIVWNFDQWDDSFESSFIRMCVCVCVFWLQNHHEVFIWSINDVKTIIRNKIWYKNRLIGCECMMTDDLKPRIEPNKHRSQIDVIYCSH